MEGEVCVLSFFVAWKEFRFTNWELHEDYAEEYAVGITLVGGDLHLISSSRRTRYCKCIVFEDWERLRFCIMRVS